MENIYSYIALAYFAIGFILTHILVGLEINPTEPEWIKTLLQQLAIIFLWLPVGLWLSWHLVIIPIFYLNNRNWERVKYFAFLLFAVPFVIFGLAGGSTLYVLAGAGCFLFSFKIYWFEPDVST